MSKLRETPRAKDFMNRRVRTVSPNASLAEVASFLLKHRISNAPVVDKCQDGDILVGIVSEADCLEFLSNEIFYGNPSAPQTARTIMRCHPVCVTPDTDVFTLASIFVNHRLRHLPVVESRTLLGIVSRRDILKALEEHYRTLLQQRDEDRSRPDPREIIHHRFIVIDR